MDKILDELENEYESMIKILSQNGEDQIIDCAKLANNGECPITYADVDKDFQGNFIPMETVLTDKEDHLTCQSLDYIFVIKRKHQLSPSFVRERSFVGQESSDNLVQNLQNIEALVQNKRT